MINSISHFWVAYSFVKMSPCANLFICEGAWLNKYMYGRVHNTHEWFSIKTSFQVQRCELKKTESGRSPINLLSKPRIKLHLFKEHLCLFNTKVRVSNIQSIVPQNAKNRAKDGWKMYNLCTWLFIHFPMVVLLAPWDHLSTLSLTLLTSFFFPYGFPRKKRENCSC